MLVMPITVLITIIVFSHRVCSEIGRTRCVHKEPRLRHTRSPLPCFKRDQFSAQPKEKGLDTARLTGKENKLSVCL